MFKAESVVKGACSVMVIGGQQFMRMSLSNLGPCKVVGYYLNDGVYARVLAGHNDVPMFERIYVMREQL